MSRPAVLSLVWVATLLLGAAWIAARLQLSVDLAYFLPQPSTLAGEILVDRLGQGPGSRFLFLTVDAGTDEDDLATFVERLREDPRFVDVLDGQPDLELGDLPDALVADRYLLNDIDWGSSALRQTLTERLRDLDFLGDEAGLTLLARDPHLASLRTLEAVAPLGDGTWTTDDGSGRYLVAESAAAPFDMEGQTAALQAIRDAAAADAVDLRSIGGTGAYGVDLGNTIRREAQWRSALAGLLVFVVLVVAYRGLRAPLVAILPLATGAVAGLLALTLAFPAVHGITLAFGFTLLGVAVDFPVHALSHARSVGGRRAAVDIWPTLRAGAFSTVLAYAAFIVSGSRGLMQLGLFSAVGLAAAALTTRWLLPRLLGGPEDRFQRGEPSGPPRYRNLVWLLPALLAVATLIARGPALWNNDLSTLTPVEPQRLAEDEQARQSVGAPELRYLAVVTGADPDQALARAEEVDRILAMGVDRGDLSGFRRASRLLSSRARQARRLSALPDPATLRARLGVVLEDLPFREDAFDAFLTDVAATAQRRPVGLDRYRGTRLADLASAGLYSLGGRWVAPITLQGLSNPEALAQTLEDADAALIDLKGASESLVATYRTRVTAILAGAFALIAVVLAWRLADGRRWLWVTGTLLASILITLAGSALALSSLSLFNLIAAVLVAGLGLDYALFASRDEADRQAAGDTRHAIAVCAVSTLCAFGILAASSLPILRNIGLTVTIGVFANVALSWWGATRPSTPGPAPDGRR